MSAEDVESLAVLIESTEIAADETGDGATTLMEGPARRLAEALIAAGYRRPAPDAGAEVAAAKALRDLPGIVEARDHWAMRAATAEGGVNAWERWAGEWLADYRDDHPTKRMSELRAAVESAAPPEPRPGGCHHFGLPGVCQCGTVVEGVASVAELTAEELDLLEDAGDSPIRIVAAARAILTARLADAAALETAVRELADGWDEGRDEGRLVWASRYIADLRALLATHGTGGTT